ncbi:MAG: lipase chaperone [Leptolyngbyaceae cyanobacterium RM2_2_4]|nr:lipase chaperone [Leptolyngbyaceae cyanobacterium RM2_2_4]
MSDVNKQNAEIEALSEEEQAQRVQINSLAPGQRSVEFVRLDPVKLFDQISQMRKEGVDEDTIREALNQFMEQATNRTQKAKTVMKRHVGSVPMPSQDEINQLYQDRYKDVDLESADSTVKLIVERLEESERARKELAQFPKLTRRAKAKIYVVKKLLQFTIFICRALGVR